MKISAGFMSLRARWGGICQARAWVTASTLRRERDVWRRAYSAVRKMTIRVDVDLIGASDDRRCQQTDDAGLASEFPWVRSDRRGRQAEAIHDHEDVRHHEQEDAEGDGGGQH